jgi:hypothetical protein
VDKTMLTSWTAIRHSPAATKRLMLACASALVLSLAISAPAYAADDDDDEMPEVTLLKKLFGIKEQPSIEYRERSPLVVPPTRNLPSPETAAAETNPAWPKDPEKQPKKKQQKYSVTDKQVNDQGKAISPYELDKGRKAGAGLTPSSSKDGGDRMSPSELGYKGGLWNSLFSGSGTEKDEIGKFDGEAPRTTLTAPPTGYMTPSPNQPYGLSAKKEAPKPFNLEDRGTQMR